MVPTSEQGGFSTFLSLIRRGGVLSGAAAFIMIIQKHFQILSEYADFHVKLFTKDGFLLPITRKEKRIAGKPDFNRAHFS